MLTSSLCVWLIVSPALLAAEPSDAARKPVVWPLDQLDVIGGHKATVIGAPRLIESPQGKGVEFRGSDGLFADANPLAGLNEFTAEVIFQPYKEGLKEQRFLHFQEDDSDNRLLFETRLTGDGQWFLDTFLKSTDGNCTLFADKSLHPIGPWYHAAVVMDGKTMRHYVNGKLELDKPLDFQFKPLGPGKTSLGVRMNKVSWFSGVIREVRITPRPLSPDEFLKP